MLKHWTSLLILSFFLGIPGTGSAGPFDIQDPTPRSVIIFVDHTAGNPAVVGGNLLETFTGAWTESGGVGTITVPKAQVVTQFELSSVSGYPHDTANWTDLVIEIDLASGSILDMRATGRVRLDPNPFAASYAWSMHLNTTSYHAFANFPSPGGLSYTQNFFALDTVTFAPDVAALFCSEYDGVVCSSLEYLAGPEPFYYVPATGRFNAIGPIQFQLGPTIALNFYGPVGDAQLFEAPPPVPIGPTAAVAIAALLGAASVASMRVRRSV